MAITFDEGIEIFDKLKKLVYVLDEKHMGACRLKWQNLMTIYFV